MDPVEDIKRGHGWVAKGEDTGDGDPGAYSQDSYDPGLFMLSTYLLHQVDTLHCLELLSIDKEHRASSLGVKVMFQRKHPSIQSHCTPVTGPDIWNSHVETQVRIVKVEGGRGRVLPFSGTKTQKAGKGIPGPRHFS